MTSGRTRGWSPSTTMTASARRRPLARREADPERARQAAAGRGFTTRRSVARRSRPRCRRRRGRARRRRSARGPRRRRASRTCCRSGRPSSRASSFGDPNRGSAPAARTTAADLHPGAPAATGRPRGRGPARASGGPCRRSPLRDDLGHDRERRLGRRRPPRSSPIGPRSRASSAVGHAGLAQPLAAVALGLARADRADVAAAAAERLDDRRLVELHVVGQDRDRVVRAEADLVGDLVGPADDEPVDVREPRRGRERRPAVDDDGLVAQLLRQPDQRAGDLDRADDDQPRPDRERLDEQLATGRSRPSARCRARARRAPRRRARRRRRRRPASPRASPSSWTTQRPRRARAVAGRVPRRTPAAARRPAAA